MKSRWVALGHESTNGIFILGLTLSISYRQLRKRLRPADCENIKHGRLLSRKERDLVVNQYCRTLAIRMRLVAIGHGHLAHVKGKRNPQTYHANKLEAKSLYAELLDLRRCGYTDSKSEANLFFNAPPHYAAAMFKTKVGTIYSILRNYAKHGNTIMPGDHDFHKNKKPKAEKASGFNMKPVEQQEDEQAALNCAGRTLQPLSAHLYPSAIQTACSRLLAKGFQSHEIDVADIEYYRDEQSSEDDAPPPYYLKRDHNRELRNLEKQFIAVCDSMARSTDGVFRHSSEIQLAHFREKIQLLKAEMRSKRKRNRIKARKLRKNPAKRQEVILEIQARIYAQ